jgi:lysophospholipase L1-like esterase
LERLRSDDLDVSDEVVVSAFGGIYTDMAKASELVTQPYQTDALIIVEVGAHSVIENQAMPLTTYRRAYGLMLDCLLASGAPVVVGTVPSLNWKRSDPLYSRANAISSSIAGEAAARGIPVADIWNATRDRPDLVSADGMHPNDEGHLAIADVYWQRIASAVHTGPHEAGHCPYATADLSTLLR